MKAFPEVKKNFGFGCMRLKMNENNEVDLDNFREMVDLFLAAGFNYFDTAHPYIDGKSDWIDLRCAEEISLKKGEFRLIPLGVAMELPRGY